MSASTYQQKKKRKKKRKKKEPTSKFLFDKHTRREEFLKNSVLLSDQKISFLLCSVFLQLFIEVKDLNILQIQPVHFKV